MRFGNILIICDDFNQRESAFKYLKKLGFHRYDLDEGHKNICVDSDKKFYDFSSEWSVSDGREKLTYQQFMEKYGMLDLKSKVEQVKQDLGYKYLSYMSIDLGYAHNYLGRVLSKGLEAKAEAKLIAKLDEFIKLHKKELTHDFEGKALNTQVEDAMMISKSEYESLRKEVSHKTQVAEKHADMRNKAELRVSELEKECGEKDTVITQQLLNSGNQVYKINELENQVKSLQKDCLNLTSDNDDLEEKYGIILKKYEKKFEDYWTVSRENVELINSKRAISICLAVSILIIVLMAAFGVLHFNGVV